MPRNASAQMVTEVETIAEITIPQSERDSVDNDFYIINRYVQNEVKPALLNQKLPKGDIVVTISRK